MTTTTKLSLDQFLAMPDTKPASEYIDGEVIQKPMPNKKHSLIQTFFARILDEFLEATGLGVIGTEWRCNFGPPSHRRSFVPDLTYIAREHDTPERYPERAPDLAIEILSPDQPAGEFADKLQFYLMHGVRLVWVVDPERRFIVAYEPGKDAVRLGLEDVLDGGAVLPGFSVPVERIFARIQGLA
jgi:Uma2 family endonuclease